MKNVKVIKIEVYRDGGTVVYEDKLNRRYFMWYPTKKIYNQKPFPRGSVGMGGIPPKYVKEINVNIKIVDKF